MEIETDSSLIGIDYFKAQRKEWLTKKLENNEPERIDAEDLKHLKEILTDEDCPQFGQKVPLNQMVEVLEEIWDDNEGQCFVCSLM